MVLFVVLLLYGLPEMWQTQTYSCDLWYLGYIHIICLWNARDTYKGEHKQK